jgi:hypothetical protein
MELKVSLEKDSVELRTDFDLDSVCRSRSTPESTVPLT